MTRGPDPQHSNADVLQVFVESPDPVLFISEVADSFDKTDEWARGILNDLVEEGLIDTKKPGHRSRVYWITQEGRRYYADSVSDGAQ